MGLKFSCRFWKYILIWRMGPHPRGRTWVHPLWLDWKNHKCFCLFHYWGHFFCIIGANRKNVTTAQCLTTTPACACVCSDVMRIYGLWRLFHYKSGGSWIKTTESNVATGNYVWVERPTRGTGWMFRIYALSLMHWIQPTGTSAWFVKGQVQLEWHMGI